MVVAVCCGRLHDLDRRWEHNFAQLDGDTFFVLLDGPRSAAAQQLADRIRACGGDVQFHGEARGLAAARNSVLDAWPTSSVLFIDDDIVLDRAAVDAIRTTFTGGAQIVGARLVPPRASKPHRWYFSAGQMHLVGWHPPGVMTRTWGACMGVDAAFAQRERLRFDLRLGRTGHRLESGDDTTFIAAMKRAGAREVVLDDVGVVHDVDVSRFTLRYLLRRAYWQGRSEVRRGQLVAGLRKECNRYLASSARRSLAPMYLAAFAVGAGHELCSRIAALISRGILQPVWCSIVGRCRYGGR